MTGRAVRAWRQRRAARPVFLGSWRTIHGRTYSIDGERFVMTGWHRDSDGHVSLDLRSRAAYLTAVRIPRRRRIAAIRRIVTRRRKGTPA